MLTSIKQRLGRDDEQGFTLIELMVVVLIIAILLAIAIPTFLGARNTANARGAQSNLRNALTAEQTAWTNNQAFIDSTLAAAAPVPSGQAQLQAIESNLKWMAASPVTKSPASQVLAITSDANQVVVVTAAGVDNNCYSIAQIEQPDGTYTAAGTFFMQSAAPTVAPLGCTSPAPPTSVAATGSATAGGPGKASATGNAGFWEASF